MYTQQSAYQKYHWQDLIFSWPDCFNSAPWTLCRPRPRIIWGYPASYKTKDFLHGKEYFWCHRWLLPSQIYLPIQINPLLSKGSLLWFKLVYSLQTVSHISCNSFLYESENRVLITVFKWFLWFTFELLKIYSLM